MFLSKTNSGVSLNAYKRRIVCYANDAPDVIYKKQPINRSLFPPLIGLLITLWSDWLAYWFAIVTEITSVVSID